MTTPTLSAAVGERELGDGEIIVSVTDTSGRIISANAVLADYSGYAVTELLGEHHNIVRHPDMPRSIFHLAWETLREGEHFHGYIKNISRDGACYWVFAHVQPEFDDLGTVMAFRSVRRRPRRSAVERIIPIYARMLEAERAAGAEAAVGAGQSVLASVLAEHRLGYDAFIASI